MDLEKAQWACETNFREAPERSGYKLWFPALLDARGALGELEEVCH